MDGILGSGVGQVIEIEMELYVDIDIIGLVRLLPSEYNRISLHNKSWGIYHYEVKFNTSKEIISKTITAFYSANFKKRECLEKWEANGLNWALSQKKDYKIGRIYSESEIDLYNKQLARRRSITKILN